MYRKILVPLDGQEFAEHEVEHALHVAAPGGEVTLICVVQDFPMVAFPAEALTIPSIQEKLDNEHERCTTYLQSIRQRILERRSDLKVEIIVGQGNVEECISEAAQEIDAELIIMAQTHKSLMQKLFSAGSTTEALLHRLELPILVVHGPPKTRIYQPRAKAHSNAGD